ncbi:hypothetical protein KSP35_18995 [Aquihabitans sp. G128]|uniref:hypothetical protein n=1 Tax=Aquihabitans sp. G128 TaxID=2849779 RepID=UPI001C24CCB6|nr:hypothetical protein [Aquihabitans sp. G128]QXC60392.1 hypothetical protein KSP35_18995 [Aquihabitans sp. G128]
MPNDDQPLDIEDQPFAADLDEPRPVVDSARDDVDDGWGPDPEPEPEAASEGAPRSVADEWVRPSGQSSSLLLIMGVLVLVMVGVVVFLAINNKDDEKAADPPAASAPTGAADPGAGGTTPATTPDPGSDPDLDGKATKVDDFKRADAPDLGTFPGLGPWTNNVGTISIEKGVARTTAVSPDSKVQLATVDAGSADVTVEAKLPSPVDRAGIAIRVASPDRFIGLFATSDYGTYTLARFENGEIDKIFGNTDLSGVQVGDVIGIRAKGSKVEVLTNGTVRNSFDDAKLDYDATGVGIFAFLDDTGPKPIDARDFANWDDFKVLAATK